MEIALTISVTIILSLVGVVWLTQTRRVDKVEDKVHGHDIELARGEEKFDQVQTKLQEIHTDVREIKQNCPKCQP